MFGKTQTSAKVAGPLSPARAALAEAIVARADAEARVEAARSAVERIEDQLFEARRRLDQVRAQAGDRASERVAALVAGGDALVVDRDRFAEKDAGDAVTACRAARDLCKAALADAESSLGFKERKVADAVGAVLATVAPRLIAEAEAARREFEAKVSVLRFLRSSLSDGHRRRLDAATAYPTNFDSGSHPVLAKWQAAAAALARDADAALPT